MDFGKKIYFSASEQNLLNDVFLLLQEIDEEIIDDVDEYKRTCLFEALTNLSNFCTEYTNLW